MAGELNGKDYVWQIDTTTPVTAESGTEANYRTVACEVSHGFNGTTNTNVISNKCTQGGWENDVVSTKSWEVPYEGQAIDPDTAEPSQVTLDELAALWASGQKFWGRRALFDETSGAFLPYREGVVLITSYEETAGTEDPFTFSSTFKGQGAPLFDAVVGD